MALRDQPYLPLYVQDFLTDEKLMECSASATGIYIRLLCVMHKSDEYGTVLLKQKDKQTDKPVKNFALKLARYMPYSVDEITAGIFELLSEKVLILNDDKLIQKRMVRDNEISNKRAEAGKKGGENTQKFAKAKVEANSEYENENEIDNVNKKSKVFKAPDISEVIEYFIANGYCEEAAIKAHSYYSIADWHDSKGAKVKNWKQKMQSVWFKEENKMKPKFIMP